MNSFRQNLEASPTAFPRLVGAGIVLAAALAGARGAEATVVLSPGAAILYPTQNVVVTASITRGGLPLVPGFHTLTITGLPPGVTAAPSAPGYTVPTFPPSITASVSFQIAAAASAVAGGPFTITVQDPASASQATFSLTIPEPALHLSITTPTITLAASTVNVPVVVTADPGFGFNVGAGGVLLEFGVDAGVPPANVTAGGAKSDLAPYATTLTFPFSRTGVVTPGSYTVGVVALWTGTTRLLKNATASLTMNVPDISVIPPALPAKVCNGGTVVPTNSFLFISNYGYAGTALVNATSVPAGIAPGGPKTIALSSGQSLGQVFTLQALGAAAGNQTMPVHLQDGVVVDKTFAVLFTVINPDVTATTTSPSISLQAGGASQAFTANTAGPPAICNAFNTVDYTITGLPAGFTLPGMVSVGGAPPVYPSASLPVSAAAGVVPGSYPANVHFNVPKTGQSGNVPVTVNVSAGADFTLGAAPPTVTIPAGQSAPIVFSLTPLNSFSGTANVTIPAIQSVTAAPSAFAVSTGKPTSVTFAVAAGTAPGTIPVTLSGAAAGVPGTRTVTINIVVPAPPDFTLAPSAPTLTLVQGASGKITFTMAALNGWNSPTVFTVPPLANVASASSAPGFAGTGGTIDVTFTASAAAPPGAIPVTVSASFQPVSGPPTTRSAAVNIVIQPAPDFTLSVTPLALGLVQGGTGPVTVSLSPLYGFAGTATVTAPAVNGVTFNPSSFSVGPGAPATVQIVTAPSAPSATSTVTFTGIAPGVAGPRTGSFSLTITPKPDFNLLVQPPSVSLAPLGTSQVTVTVQGSLGGSVDVVAPTTIPGVSFSPPTLPIPVGGSGTFSLTAGAAAAGTVTGVFTGTATGGTLQHTANFTTSITGSPEFQVVLTPPALVLTAGASAAASVAIKPINGLGGAFNVTIAPPSGITVTPLSIPNATANTPTALNVSAAPGVSGAFDIPVSATSTLLPLTRSATLRINVPAPDYTLTAAPASLLLAPGASAPVTITASPVNGFSGTVTVVPAVPAGLDVDQKTFTLGPGESKTVVVSAPSGATTGFVSFPFNGTSPGIPPRSVSVPVSIQATPDFKLLVTPAAISLPAGGKAAAQVTLVPIGGWTGGVDVRVTGPAGISVVPSQFPLQQGVPYAVEIRADDTAPAGAVSLLFDASGANGGAGVTVTRTVNVQITVAASDFKVRITPTAPEVTAGGAATLTFILDPVGVFAGTVAVTPLNLPAGATLTPAQPLLAPNVPQAATLSLARGTPPGAYTLTFRADETTGPNLRGRGPLLISKTLTLPLVVLKAGGGFSVVALPPSVLASPGQIVAVRYEFRNLGAEPLVITGDTFTRRDRSGAVLDTTEESVGLALPAGGTATASNTVVATGEQFAQAGSPAVVIEDRTFRAAPDSTGFAAEATASVAVTAVNSLLATASVTGLSVVYPPSGTLVGRGDNLRAQGVIFGSGTGNVLVGWLYDGVLVETATVPLQSGAPTSVTNAVSLPTLLAGNHEIALAILSPNTLTSPSVQIYVDEGLTTLRLVAPSAGAIFAPAFAVPTFSWIPAPGIARYGVGLRRRGTGGARYRWAFTSDTFWGPPASLWNELPEGDYEWIVRGFTASGRSLLDRQMGGATAPPTSEGSRDVGDGWTVTSATGRFSIGGGDASLADLAGLATPGEGGIRFAWKEIAGALYVHALYVETPEGPRRVRTEIVPKAGLLLPAGSLPRGGPLRWRVTASDRDGRPLGATPLAAVPGVAP